MDSAYFYDFRKNSIEWTELTEKYVNSISQEGIGIIIPCRSGLQRVFRHPGKKSYGATIFELHGGCFSQGTSANDDKMREAFCKKTGYQVIGLGYRKSTNSTYPAAIEDVFDQICYFIDHAEEYQIDPQKIGIWGHSAGGNLACAVTWKGIAEKRFNVALLLLDYPYLDTYSPGKFRSSETSGITADELDAMSELYAPGIDRREKMLSPVFASEEDLKKLPPATFVICGRDPLASEDETMLFRMLQCGVPIYAKKYPRMEHGFLELWFFREWYLKETSIPDEMEEDALNALEFQAHSAVCHFEQSYQMKEGTQ